MNDDELDDLMRREAQSYHLPPETPREAMWARIEQARGGATPITIIASRRTRWLRTAAGIAAVLFVGIGIGRLSHGAAGTPPSASTRTSDGAGPTSATPSRVAEVTPDAPTSHEPDAGAASHGTRAVTHGAGESPGSRAARGPATRFAPADAGASAYHLAVLEHMARTEVLLTSFRAQSREGASEARLDAQFADVSRELLQTTRLLLATRTNDDPHLTRLLEDLELVLMQISQYTAEGRRGDLDAINQSLDRRNVIPKLRNTVPAGASASAGT